MNNKVYIEINLSESEITEIVNLSMDSIYASVESKGIEKDEKGKTMVKKLVQNHSRR